MKLNILPSTYLTKQNSTEYDKKTFISPLESIVKFKQKHQFSYENKHTRKKIYILFKNVCPIV